MSYLTFSGSLLRFSTILVNGLLVNVQMLYGFCIHHFAKKKKDHVKIIDWVNYHIKVKMNESLRKTVILIYADQFPLYDHAF